MLLHWPHASSPPELGADEAHVWAIRLDVDASRLRSFEVTLSADERARAQAFRTEELRRRFIAAHGSTRAILSHYVEESPEKIALAFEHRGKPRLGDAYAATNLRFNLSHSADLALLAVVKNCEVGIDVEELRPVKELEHLVTRYFHHDEANDVLLAAGDRNAAFFRCWTAKEGVLKAFGSGIAESLDHFRVPPCETASGWVDVSAMPKFVDASQCWVTRLDLCDNYEAAIAFVGPERRVRGFVFDA
jgi:4'-phosphopantetheinyl transferase